MLDWASFACKSGTLQVLLKTVKKLKFQSHWKQSSLLMHELDFFSEQAHWVLNDRKDCFLHKFEWHWHSIPNLNIEVNCFHWVQTVAQKGRLDATLAQLPMQFINSGQHCNWQRTAATCRCPNQTSTILYSKVWKNDWTPGFMLWSLHPSECVQRIMWSDFSSNIILNWESFDNQRRCRRSFRSTTIASRPQSSPKLSVSGQSLHKQSVCFCGAIRMWSSIMIKTQLSGIFNEWHPGVQPKTDKVMKCRPSWWTSNQTNNNDHSEVK